MAQLDQLSTDVLEATQKLNGLLVDQTAVTGQTLAKAMFGFGASSVHLHSKPSPKVPGERRNALLSRAIREGDVAITLFAIIIAS